MAGHLWEKEWNKSQSTESSAHVGLQVCREADVKKTGPDKMDSILKNVQFL